MIELLGALIVFVVVISAVSLFYGLIAMVIGGVVALLVQVVVGPWKLYRWWQKRSIARDKILAQRTAAIQKAFIREAHLQNGPQGW